MLVRRTLTILATVAIGGAVLAGTSPVSAGTAQAAAANAKKGVGAWVFDGVHRALIKSGVSWYYTWGVSHPGITNPKGVSFVPMIWGAGELGGRPGRAVPVRRGPDPERPGLRIRRRPALAGLG
jgi:hypothetical protein